MIPPVLRHLPDLEPLRPLLDGSGQAVVVVDAEPLESERLYRTLARHLPRSVVTLYDRELRCLLAEGGALREAGKTPGELEGRSLRELAKPELIPFYEAVFEGRTTDVETATDGRYHRVQLLPVRDERGAIIAGLMVSEDITEKRRQDEALHRSEERFATLTANAPIAMFETDASGNCVFVNERWKRLTGLTNDEALGQGWGRAIHEDDRTRVLAAWSEAVESGAQFNAELRYRHTGGGASWVVVIAAPLRDESGHTSGYLGTATDITERRQMEELTRRALQEKETLLKEIHHRVKNNLQVVSSLLGLQATHTTDPAVRAMFDETQGRVRSISLLHEKLYQGRDLARLDMEQYLRELAFGVVRAQAEGARTPVAITVHASGVFLDLEHAVPCGLILNELVTNVLKHAFGAPGSPLESAVEITMTDDDGQIRLVVRDNGRGFPPALDFRAAQTMGLHLVRTLTRQLRGTLDIQSDAGAVCTVAFRVPPPRAEEGSP